MNSSATSISTQSIIVNEQTLAKTIDTVHGTILHKLFGTGTNHLELLLQTVSALSSNSGDYGFELRVIDELSPFGGHASKHSWNLFDARSDKSLELISYADDVMYTFKPQLQLRDVTFRKSDTTGLCEKKILINTISTQSEPSILPLNVRLTTSHLVSIKDLPPIIDTQRRQRLVYKFNDPTLSDWHVMKSLRFIVTDSECVSIGTSKQSKKITRKLNVNNALDPQFYDYLDVSFVYVGDYSDIYSSFFKLIERVYPSRADFNIDCNIIRAIVEFDGLFPTAHILTEDITRNGKPSEYTLSYNIDGERRQLFIVNKQVYELSRNGFKEIVNESHSTSDIGATHTVKTEKTLLDRLMSYQKSDYRNRSVDYLITVFDCEYFDDVYYVFDAYCINSQVINELPYMRRYQALTNYIRRNEYPNGISLDVNPLLNASTRAHSSWKAFLRIIEQETRIKHTTRDGITKVIPIDGCIVRSSNASFVESLVYKSKAKRHISFNVRLMYVPEEKHYLIYTTGYIDDVVKNASIYNQHSIEHFAYSLVSYINGSSTGTAKTTEWSVLFATPYIDSFVGKTTNCHPAYEFHPRLDWNRTTYSEKKIEKVNTLMTAMLEHPLKFNNCVVEMTIVGDGWIPLKVLNDANIVNDGSNIREYTYKEGINVMSLLYNDFGERSTNVTVDIPYEVFHVSSVKSIYEITYKLMDQYIIERYISSHSYKNIIDVFDSKYINISTLYGLGNVSTIYAINSSRSALIRYVNTSMKHSITPSTFLTNTRVMTSRVLDVNVIDKGFTHTDTPLLESLMRHYKYANNSINLIFVQDQLDGVLSSVVGIEAFIDFANNVLSANGRIIIKYFDGNIMENSNDSLKIFSNKFEAMRYANVPIKQLVLGERLTLSLCQIFNINEVLYVPTIDDADEVMIDNTRFTILFVLSDEWMSIDPDATIPFKDGFIMIYYPTNNNERVTNIAMEYAMKAINGNFTPYKYYLHPDYSFNDIHEESVNDPASVFIARPIIDKSVIELYSRHFDVIDIVQPLRTNEVAKRISSHNAYMRIEEVETYMQAFTVVILERKLV